MFNNHRQTLIKPNKNQHLTQTTKTSKLTYKTSLKYSKNLAFPRMIHFNPLFYKVFAAFIILKYKENGYSTLFQVFVPNKQRIIAICFYIEFIKQHKT